VLTHVLWACSCLPPWRGLCLAGLKREWLIGQQLNNLSKDNKDIPGTFLSSHACTVTCLLPRSLCDMSPLLQAGLYSRLYPLTFSCFVWLSAGPSCMNIIACSWCVHGLWLGRFTAGLLCMSCTCRIYVHWGCPCEWSWRWQYWYAGGPRH